MNTNETSLQVVGNYGILKKIISFFKRITNKKETNYSYFSVNGKNNSMKSNNFLNSIKYTEDPDKQDLLKIQEELEKMGINKKNAFLLTKDLSEIQKKKLLDLYKEQIDSLNTNINNCKGKIIKIRKRLQADS